MCTGTNASVPLRLGFDLACDDGVCSRTNSSSSVSSWTGVSISLSSCSIVVALWVHYQYHVIGASYTRLL